MPVAAARLGDPVKLNTPMGGAVDWRENNRQVGLGSTSQ